MSQERFVLGLLVNNDAGVLTRVSGLFGRRGYNIDSLSVGETEDPAISRMTISTNGDAQVREQMLLQLKKLHDVLRVEVMDAERTVFRELMLLKVRVDDTQLSVVQETAKVFRARIVDLAPQSVIVEITGDQCKLDAFVANMQAYGITELCRTGLTAIGRGEYKLELQEEE